MTELNVILPGLIWPDPADLAYILNNETYPSISAIFAKGKLSQQTWAYSDFYYQPAFKDKTLSLAQNYAKILALPDTHGYLLVEPTNLRADRDRLLIAESALLQIDESEARVLLTRLNQHFSEDNLKFHYLEDELWLLELPEQVNDLLTYPLLDIIGNNIDDYLPQGNNAIAFHRLLNEIQMLFFTEEINQTRENEGLLTINSVWFWDKNYIDLGIDYAGLLSNIKNLGRKFQLEALKEHMQGNSLILIDQAYYPAVYRDSFAWVKILAELDSKFITPMLKMLKSGKINKIKFYLPYLGNSWQIILRRHDLFKFWRKIKYKDLIIKLLN